MTKLKFVVILNHLPLAVAMLNTHISRNFVFTTFKQISAGGLVSFACVKRTVLLLTWALVLNHLISNMLKS